MKIICEACGYINEAFGRCVRCGEALVKLGTCGSCKGCAHGGRCAYKGGEPNGRKPENNAR